MVIASLILVSCLFWTIEGQSIRLVTKREQTSLSLTAGRLEVYYNGQWGTVCDHSHSFGSTEAKVACRQLGFGPSYLDYGIVGSPALRFDVASQSTPIWLDNLSCSNYATSIIQCSSHGVGVHDCTNHREDIALSCSGDGALRLSGALISGSAGRVEVYYNGQWGTVCDDFFDQTDADVACRQLGYDSASRYGSVGTFGFSEGNGRILLDNLQCTSSDLMLSTCSHRGFGNENCDHSEDVAVLCTSADESPPIRLVAKGEQTSSYLTAGRLEVYHNGQWGTVCDSGFYIIEETVACRQLGFPSSLGHGKVGLGYTRRFDEASSSTPIWLSDMVCSSYATSLSQCEDIKYGVNSCTHSEDVALFCVGDGALRLNGSYDYLTYTSSGRLEVYYNGQWGTVCDHSFDQTDADVACRQLGFASASNYGHVGSLGLNFSQGTGTIWLDDLQCTSSDLMLSMCSHRGFGNENCDHSEDVAVSCSHSTNVSQTRSLSFGAVCGIVTTVVIVFVGIVAGIICCIIRVGRQRSIRRGTAAANSNYPATILTSRSTRSSSNFAYSAIPQEPPPPYPGSPTTYTLVDGPPQPQTQQLVSYEYPQGCPQQAPEYGAPYYPPAAESEAPTPSTSQPYSESDNLLQPQCRYEIQPPEPTAPPIIVPQDHVYPPHSDPACPPTAGVHTIVAPYPTTAAGGTDTITHNPHLKVNSNNSVL